MSDSNENENIGMDPVMDEATREEIEDYMASLSDEEEEMAQVVTEFYNLMRRPISPVDLELPDTVTKLTTADGSTVYLVGTAHFSKESQNDVSRTISLAEPNVVLVELCKDRMNILKLDEETIIREAKDMSLEKIRTVIKQNGFIHGIMYLFLMKMSAHITKELGMAPGGEFRTAFAEAKKVPGCMIHLGDRPIQITLHRALSQLSWWQKLSLAWNVITVTNEPITKEDVEKCKNKDLIEQLLADMTGKYPVFSRVFVKERDMYLAHTLRLAATPLPCRGTPTGNVPAIVVGVVGIGHIPGIIAQWEKVDDADIPELLRIPPASRANRVVKYSVKASVWCLLAWGLYKALARPSILNLIHRASNGRF